MITCKPAICAHMSLLLPCCCCPQKEKETSGLADVPGGAKGKLLEVEYAFTEDRKLRGQLRDPGAIEAQVRHVAAAARSASWQWAWWPIHSTTICSI